MDYIMKLNYLDMKKKFNLKYAINPLKSDCIIELFESETPFLLFDHPNECMMYHYDQENSRISKRKEKISEDISKIENINIFKKIIFIFSIYKQKIKLYKEYQNEIDKHSLNINRLFDLSVFHINKNTIFNVENPDLKKGDTLYLISLNKDKFEMNYLEIFNIKYYCFDNNNFKINIYAIDNKTKREYLILSNEKGELTNRLFENYIFKNKRDAKKFLMSK